MGSDPALIVFSSPAQMAARLADLLEAALGRAVAAQGLASIALSGGATPAPLYSALAARDIDWPNVTATLVDERFVPPSAAGSNEAFLRAALLDAGAASARFVGLWNEAPTLEAAAAAANERLASVIRPYDAVVLGMGADGHTASWFPRASGLDRALADDAPLVVPVRAAASASTGGHLDRLTLSLRAIASARLLILMLTGAEKRRAFETFAGAGPVEDAPVRAVLRARPDIWVAWAP